MKKWGCLNAHICLRKLEDKYTGNWTNQNLSISFKRLFNCYRLKTIHSISHEVQREILPVIILTELLSPWRNGRRTNGREHIGPGDFLPPSSADSSELWGVTEWNGVTVRAVQITYGIESQHHLWEIIHVTSECSVIWIFSKTPYLTGSTINGRVNYLIELNYTPTWNKSWLKCMHSR